MSSSRPPIGDGTRAVHAGVPPPRQGAAPVPGPTFAGYYHLEGDPEGVDYVYGRYGNPTWTLLENALAELEGGPAVSFASGMAAVSAVLLPLLRGGDGGHSARERDRRAALELGQGVLQQRPRRVAVAAVDVRGRLGVALQVVVARERRPGDGRGALARRWHPGVDGARAIAHSLARAHPCSKAGWRDRTLRPGTVFAGV